MTIDVDALIGAPVAPLSTEYELIREGEYQATIDATDVKTWFQSGKRDDGSSYIVVNVPFVIIDEAQREQLGRTKLTARMSCFLDFDAAGKLSADKGKNVTLGQLREALGQNNDPNWSFLSLPGSGPVKVQTKNGESKTGAKFTNITRVTKI